VTQMDEVTQQNAALVEQASAAAESLQEQAGGLVQSVATFKLEGGAVARVAQRPAASVTALPAKPATVKAPAQGSALARRAAANNGHHVAKPAVAARAKAVGGEESWEEF
ncbi:MAG: methyl-accepting chemotaxis protein, partial [Betaproteobacteria bacterium]|nr:methyl-accepting chemotaxis protein [Betaproteobacteria bacterium]